MNNGRITRADRHALDPAETVTAPCKGAVRQIVTAISPSRLVSFGFSR